MKIALFLFLILGSVINAQESIERVIFFGATTQGNGYNHPATTGWISSKLEEAIESADKINAQTGEKVGLVFAGFSGGSSGSGITLTMQSLLRNPDLFEDISDVENTHRVLSIEDAKRFAAAIRFCSMGSDMSKLLKYTTLIRIARQKLIGVIDRLSDFSSHIPDWLGGGRVNLWVEQLNGKVVVNDFAWLITFAQRLKWSDINQDTDFKALGVSPEDLETDKARSILESLKKLHYFPEGDIYSGDDISDLDKSLLQKVMKKQSHRMKKIVKKTMKNIFKEEGAIEILKRYQRARPSVDQAPSNPYQKAFSKAMGDGFLTATFAIPGENMDKLNDKIAKEGMKYSDLNLYMIGNETTVKEIIENPDYQKLKSNPYFSRIKFLVIKDQQWTALNSSVREPRLLGELAGDLAGENFMVTKVYDPIADVGRKFKVMPIDEYPLKSIYVAGGFAYEQMVAVPSSFYYLSLLKKIKKKYHVEKAVYHLFGHPKNRLNPNETFAGKVLKSLMTGKGKGISFDNAMDDYLRWTSQFTEVFQKGLFKENGVERIDTLYHWNITTLPATLNGTSRVLALQSSFEAKKNKPWLEFKVAKKGCAQLLNQFLTL